MTRCALTVLIAAGLAAPAALAEWNPQAGQWGKTDPRDLRVMTWNVEDILCSSAIKTEDLNAWTGFTRIVAAMKPDVLILQECGDNTGNGTGSFSDPPSFLLDAVNMFQNGGIDIYNGNVPVGSWLKKYDANLDYPYVFVSTDSDGFNRNVILSKHPFVDLNGDNRATVADFNMIAAAYAPGGDGGVRGFMTAEIDLPDNLYRGDLVVGNSHLKAFGDADSQAQRITAARNIAYYIDYFFGGAGTGSPNPGGAVQGAQPTVILNEFTPVIWGGDWNEDEQTNGRKGPAEWMTQAQTFGGTDGTDRNRSDSTFDDARDPFNNARGTRGSSKLDYIGWQDSIVTLRRSFVFNSATVTPATNLPPEVLNFGLGNLLSGVASDHRPVVADFILPEPVAIPCPADLDGDGAVSASDLASLLGAWGGGGPADLNGSGTVDSADLAALLGAWGACP